MNMWLVGAGYWGSKLATNLARFGVNSHIIDIKNGQTIEDINTRDPVVLATPLWQHSEQTQKLLRQGLDVYVEKPMAETVAQIDQIESCLAPDQLLMVGHLFVHHPQLSEIKQLIQQHTIGDLWHITSQRLNWGIYQTKTDPLLSLATHDVSIVQEFLGADITVTTARCWNWSNNVTYDRAWFEGGAANGVTFDIDVSWHWPQRVRCTTFIGSKGQIVWNQDSNTVTLTTHHIEDRRAVVDVNPRVIQYNHTLTPLETELTHWINCVIMRTQPRTGIAQARDVIRIIEQAKSLL